MKKESSVMGDKGLFLSPGTPFRLNIPSWPRYYHRMNVIGIETRVLHTGILGLQASAVHFNDFCQKRTQKVATIIPQGYLQSYISL